MTKESRTASDKEMKMIAAQFDMTLAQYKKLLAAAGSMSKKNDGGPIVKNKMNKGLAALKKEAPDVVKNMGYKKGGTMKDYSKKKPYQMNMGGMMEKEKKVNPTTGMTMNKGGMTDMRKAGMFYGGGMAKKSKMMYGGMASKKMK